MSYTRTSASSKVKTPDIEVTCDLVLENERSDNDDGDDAELCSHSLRTLIANNEGEEISQTSSNHMLLSSVTPPQSPTSCVTIVWDVNSKLELVARNANSFIKNDETGQEALRLPRSGENESCNFDLKSDKNIMIDSDGRNDISCKITVSNGCDRCAEFETIVQAKDAQLLDLNEKYSELTRKQKLFIVSNCELNEENEDLRTLNRQLKSELSSLTSEHTQLLSENQDLQRRLAVVTDRRKKVERSRIGSSPSYPLDSDPNCRDVSNSSVKNDLRQAIAMSREQQVALWKLQHTITRQSQTIKALCSTPRRLEQMSKRFVIPESNQGELYMEKLSGKNKGPDEKVSFDMTTGNTASVPVAPGHITINTRTAAAGINKESDIYSHGKGLYQGQKQQIGIQRETQFNVSRISPTKKDKDKLKKQLPILYLDKNAATGAKMKHSGIKSDPDAPVDQPVQPLDEVLNLTLSPSLHEQDESFAQVELTVCPLCSRKFISTEKNFAARFQEHIDKCLVSEGRQCPMCFKRMPNSISQADFEKHVNSHFIEESRDYEVLSPSE